MLQAIEDMPGALAEDTASAFCNHGLILQNRAGADYARLENGIDFFRRYSYPSVITCLGNFSSENLPCREVGGV